MPKRIVDGQGVWRSDKIAKLPAWVRPEYANLLPLAHANGSFECEVRRVWSDVYSYNRPEMTPEKVEELLAELEKAKLLFRWTDSEGKQWGFWIGIDKPGRLPARSRLKTGHETLGAEPPANEVQAFIANGQPTASHSSANGSLGLGLGLGLGIGCSRDNSGNHCGNGQNVAHAVAHEFGIVDRPTITVIADAISLEMQSGGNDEIAVADEARAAIRAYQQTDEFQGTFRKGWKTFFGDRSTWRKYVTMSAPRKTIRPSEAQDMALARTQ